MFSSVEQKIKALTVCSEPTSHCLGHDLVRCYNQRKFSDVTLLVKDQKFHAHRLILGARSPVFSAMFENDLKEKRTGIVNIPDIDPDTVDMMLTFMYSDTLDLQGKSAITLYSVADQYEIVSLKDHCRSYLKSKLDFSNVIEVFILTDRHHDLELRNSALDFATNHATGIFRSKEWENFVVSHSHLAAKIMHQVFVVKEMAVVKGMSIYARTFTGKVIALQVLPNDTVANLKIKVQEKEGIAAETVRLIFNGIQLEDLRTVSHYQIQKGSTLQVLMRFRGD